MSIRLSCLSGLFLLSCLTAVSAPPEPFIVNQPDGTEIPVRMFGHEYYNWIETLDGYVIKRVNKGDNPGWYYAELDENGKYVPSEVYTIYPMPNGLPMQKHLRESRPELRKIEMGHYSGFSSNPLDRSVSSFSTFKPLVLLVDFPDANLPNGMPSHEYDPEHFSSLIFAEDLNPPSANLPSSYQMSVRDYYSEISNAHLTIEGSVNSVVDWTTVSNNYSYYVDGVQGTGIGNGAGGTNNYAQSAAAALVEIIMEKQNEINFNNFDGNEDGVLDVVIIIVEGWGSGSDNEFWPFKGYIGHGSNGIAAIDPTAPQNAQGFFSFNNIAIKHFIVIPERSYHNSGGAQQGNIHPIGTICHELGHVLGLPDLYDTSPSSAAGIGAWGLMGSGNWYSQTSPAYMMAWSRNKLGFIDVILLDNVIEADITLPPVENDISPAVFQLALDSANPKEYLLLENRQKNGSDEDLPYHGLLAWHIDETILDQFPAMNSVNIDEDYYGIKLLQADGDGDLHLASSGNSGDNGDPLPGIENNTELADNTNPNTLTYEYDRNGDGAVQGGQNSGIAIADIVENNDEISCTISSPNNLGDILAYDEGGWQGMGFNPTDLTSAGIRFTVDDSYFLTAISTPVPASNWSWEAEQLDIRIWEGWSGGQPQNIISETVQIINMNPYNGRDGGWVDIEISMEAPLRPNVSYFAEIIYQGSGFIMPFDAGYILTSAASNQSYYSVGSSYYSRPDGDWNIRLSLSQDQCLISAEGEIWPGNTDGSDSVDENDILPIGIFWGVEGCYRLGDVYSWESQSKAGSWDDPCAAHADANGDGVVNIADVLVVLVNWNKQTTDENGNPYIVDESCSDMASLAEYEERFYEIYQSLAGSSEAEILIRARLEELFGFTALPSQFILKQNYPNPFNAETVIPFYLGEIGSISLSIYNLNGREVDRLVQSAISEGWNKIHYRPDRLSSGIYFYTLDFNGQSTPAQKMLLLK